MIVWIFICLWQISHLKWGNLVAFADSDIKLKHLSQKKQQQLAKNLGSFSKQKNFYKMILSKKRLFVTLAFFTG